MSALIDMPTLGYIMFNVISLDTRPGAWSRRLDILRLIDKRLDTFAVTGQASYINLPFSLRCALVFESDNI